MADVNRARLADSSARDRAQLLLIAGLVMAVSFVVLALTLNTVIYTENLATRSSDIAGGDDATRFLDETKAGLGSVLHFTNRNTNESLDKIHETAIANIAVWRNTTGRIYSMNGVVTNISNVRITNGSRVLQTDGSRNFSDARANSNWTLASGATGIRQFGFNVTVASLTDSTQSPDETSDVFYVRFTNPSTEWKVFIYQNQSDSNSLNVTVRNETADETFDPCSARGDHIFVNISAATVGGDSCSALSFVSEFESSFTITYNETIPALGESNANGTYHMMLDTPDLAASPGPKLHDGPGTSPWADAAAYAFEFDAIYETSQLRYNASVFLAPEGSR